MSFILVIPTMAPIRVTNAALINVMRNINSMFKVVQVAKRMSKDVLIIGVEL